MSKSKTKPIRDPMMALVADSRALRTHALQLRQTERPEQVEQVEGMLAVFDNVYEMVLELQAAIPDSIMPDVPEDELHAALPVLNRLVDPEREIKGDQPEVNPPQTNSDRIPQRKRHLKRRWTALTCNQILALADEYYSRHGAWPSANSGKISNASEDSWEGFNQSLRLGRRGLPGGSSLVKLLIDEERLPPAEIKPDCDIDQILAWADAHHARTKKWPNTCSGPVTESPGNTWHGLDKAMRLGRRGLPGGASLLRMLNEKRGAPTYLCRELLTEEKILRWADAHFDRTGRWPTQDSGEVFDAPGEIWDLINNALMRGHRSLPEGSSLPRLLAESRGKRHSKLLPELDLMRINVWVLNHYTRTGRLPRVKDGRIAEAPDESWAIVDIAFRSGSRGFANSGFSTLKEFPDARFTRADFGQRVLLKPRLYISIILKWADAYHTRTGN